MFGWYVLYNYYYFYSIFFYPEIYPTLALFTLISFVKKSKKVINTNSVSVSKFYLIYIKLTSVYTVYVDKFLSKK